MCPYLGETSPLPKHVILVASNPGQRQYAFMTTSGSAPRYLNSVLQAYVPFKILRSASEWRFIVPSQRGTKSLSLTFINCSLLVKLPAQFNPSSSILSYLQETAKITSLPSLFDPLTLALSIIILFNLSGLLYILHTHLIIFIYLSESELAILSRYVTHTRNLDSSFTVQQNDSDRTHTTKEQYTKHVKLQVVKIAPDNQFLNLLSVNRLMTILNEADQCGVVCKLDRGVFRCAVIRVQGKWGENTALRSSSADCTGVG